MNYFRNTLPVLLFASVLFTGISYAENWQLYTEQDGIRIEYKYADCYLERGYDQQRILLKITNTSGNTKLVEWKINLWYNNDCKTCDVKGPEYRKSVSIDSGKTIEGVCSIYSDAVLTIFVKFTDKQYQNSNKQILTKFELDDINITTAIRNKP